MHKHPMPEIYWQPFQEEKVDWLIGCIFNLIYYLYRLYLLFRCQRMNGRNDKDKENGATKVYIRFDI
jgi:hypothetical protein